MNQIECSFREWDYFGKQAKSVGILPPFNGVLSLTAEQLIDLLNSWGDPSADYDAGYEEGYEDGRKEV